MTRVHVQYLAMLRAYYGTDRTHSDLIRLAGSGATLADSGLRK